MNERINQLWEESQQWNGSDDGRGGLKIHESVEKFAELIIKECVRHFNEDYQRDFDTLWREDLSQSIKEHFGVD